MSITLVAVVLALVLGHVAPTLVASLRRYAWYDAWLHWLGESAGGAWQARHGIALRFDAAAGGTVSSCSGATATVAIVRRSAVTR